MESLDQVVIEPQKVCFIDDEGWLLGTCALKEEFADSLRYMPQESFYDA